MIKPTIIQADLEAEAAYVRYSDEKIAGTEDVWEDGQVAADFDEHGKVVGIELLGFDEETLERARTFAQQHDLGFPANLAGVLVAA